MSRLIGGGKGSMIYTMNDPFSRRKAIQLGVAGSVANIATVQIVSAKIFVPTPPDAEGPFYPVAEQKDKDFDLTQVDGKSGKAKGEVVEIEGRVLDITGRPVSGAKVDLWQANAAGRYRHPRDPNKAELDPNFQGWAIVPSGEEGGFRFKTIKPGAYPAGRSWTRPPHIHFKVSRQGYQPLTTQMYFPGESLNAKDGLLQRKDAESQKLMIARPSESGEGKLIYDIILAPVRGKQSRQAD